MQHRTTFAALLVLGTFLSACARLGASARPKAETPLPAQMAPGNARPPPGASTSPGAAEPSASAVPPVRPSSDQCNVSAVQQREVLGLVARARRASAARNYAAAQAALGEALALDACDANTLGELGWVAYLAHDLTLAEDSTRAAIERRLLLAAAIFIDSTGVRSTDCALLDKSPHAAGDSHRPARHLHQERPRERRTA
jgi:hypothetical protein